MFKIFIFIALFFGSLDAQVRILTNEEPPQCYTKNGEITGIGTDIIKEIQKKVGTSQEIEVLTWTRAMALAKRKKNTLLYLAGRTKDREPFLTFIGPILKKTYKLYGLNGKNFLIQNMDEAKQIDNISCVMDDVREVFLRENNFHNLIYLEDHSKALRNMLAGKSSLWASSDWENGIQMRSINQDPKSIKPFYTLYTNYNYIAFNKKTDSKIIEKWSDALKEIKQDGTIDKIAQKWSKILNLNLKYLKEDDAIGIIE